MAGDDVRLFLITPPIANADIFAPILEAALSTCDIASVLLRIEAPDTREAKSIVRKLAPIAQNLDVACLVEADPQLAISTGADGAHVTADAECIEEALRVLHPGRIVGVGGLTTRDAAMIAGEAGADYLMFGGTGCAEPRTVVVEQVAWWAEIFNVPCVGYAHDLGEIPDLVRAGADFVALGDAVFADPRGVTAALREAAFALARAGEPA